MADYWIYLSIKIKINKRVSKSKFHRQCLPTNQNFEDKQKTEDKQLFSKLGRYPANAQEILTLDTRYKY